MKIARGLQCISDINSAAVLACIDHHMISVELCSACELDDNVKVPRPARCGMRTAPNIVPRQPCAHVRSETDMEMRVRIFVSQNIDEPLVARH